MVLGVVISGFVFLGIVVLLILILRRQLAKTEEKKLLLTAKLTGVIECEARLRQLAATNMTNIRQILINMSFALCIIALLYLRFETKL